MTAERPVGRRTLLTTVAALGAGVPLTGCGPRPGGPAEPVVVATADLSSVVATTTPWSVGYGSSTYGPTPLSSPEQAAAERTLDARLVRLPVGVRGGRVTSSAAGGPTDLDVPALVGRYRSWGFRVLVVVGGRTTDVDLQPGDATTVIRALGTDGVAYSSPNEPGHLKLSVARAADLARMVLAEGRAIDPAFRIWGPAWAGFDRDALRAFAAAIGPDLAGVDYHRYAMGDRPVETRTALAATPSYGDDVRAVRADLAALGLTADVSLSEVNWASTPDNGTPDGEQRLYGAENLVYLTSVIGHVLRAGGSVLPYAAQNGALGLTADPANPRGWPASAPMPAYWAVAAWTGAGRRPHLDRQLFATTSSDPEVEVFAFGSADGSRTVLLLNTSPVARRTVSLTLAGAAASGWTAFATDAADPQVEPARTGAGTLTDGRPLTFTLRPLTVTTLVVGRG